jgi:RNA polymerase sigma-70 factor, ECF subfamily
LTLPDLRLCRGDVISSMSRQNRSHASGLRLVDGEGEGAAPPLTDAQLVLALREDEAGAAAELWSRCSPAVARLLGKTLGPGPEIEDLTQEVFLRFFVRLSSLRDPTALRAFVLSVAMNVLKWELRRRWVRRKVRLSDSGTLPDVEGTSADMEARDALRRCYRILDTLPTNERLAFVCRYMEEMTIDETAAVLVISASTAKRWVRGGAAKVAAQAASDPGLHGLLARVRDGGKGGI